MKLAVLVMAVALVPAAAWAMGGTTPPPAPAAARPVDPEFAAARAAIDRKDWDAAIAGFQKVVARDARNADAFNYLGFAERSRGNLEQAFRHYATALAIDPRHKGAHEYVGEAHLKAGNIAKAEEHLKILDDLCSFGCAEYSELQAKIAAAKAARRS